MPARAFKCPACQRPLGTISRKHDGQGNPKDRLRLREGVKGERELFRRQRYAECVCGHKTLIPDGWTVEVS